MNAKQKAMEIGEDEIAIIREALNIGLASYGEIERLTNAVMIEENICHREVPKELHPIHPTGCSDTVSQFAGALRGLDLLSWQVSRAERE